MNSRIETSSGKSSHVFGIAVLLLVFGSIFLTFQISFFWGLLHLVIGGVFFGISVFSGVRQLFLYPKKGLAGFVCLIFIAGVYLLGVSLHGELDLTENGKFSLSSGSKRTLKEIQSEVVVYHIDVGEVTTFQSEQTLLRLITNNSPILEYQRVDPVYDVQVIEQLELKAGDRVVLFRDREDPIRLKSVSEEGVISALQRLTNVEPMKVYYLTGHGEPSLLDRGPLGLSRMGELLQAERAEVIEINLEEEEAASVDKNALLLLVDPKKPLSRGEEEELAQFIDSGGSFFVALEGPDGLPTFLADQGLGLIDEPALRMSKRNNGEEYFSYDIPISLYPTHGITQFLTGEASLLLSRAYPIQFTSEKPPTLLERRDFLRYRMSGEQDLSKPRFLNFGVFLEGKNGSRIQLVGDTSWMRNRMIGKVFNQELLRGALYWGARADQGEALKGKTASSFVVISEFQLLRLQALFLFMGEALLLLFLVLFWRRRRRAFLSRLATV